MSLLYVVINVIQNNVFGIVIGLWIFSFLLILISISTCIKSKYRHDICKTCSHKCHEKTLSCSSLNLLDRDILESNKIILTLESKDIPNSIFFVCKCNLCMCSQHDKFYKVCKWITKRWKITMCICIMFSILIPMILIYSFGRTSFSISVAFLDYAIIVSFFIFSIFLIFSISIFLLNQSLKLGSGELIIKNYSSVVTEEIFNLNNNI